MPGARRVIGPDLPRLSNVNLLLRWKRALPVKGFDRATTDNTGVIDFSADLFFNAFTDSEGSVACRGIISHRRFPLN